MTFSVGSEERELYVEQGLSVKEKVDTVLPDEDDVVDEPSNYSERELLEARGEAFVDDSTTEPLCWRTPVVAPLAWEFAEILDTVRLEVVNPDGALKRVSPVPPRSLSTAVLRLAALLVRGLDDPDSTVLGFAPSDNLAPSHKYDRLPYTIAYLNEKWGVDTKRVSNQVPVVARVIANRADEIGGPAADIDITIEDVEEWSKLHPPRPKY